MMNGKHMMKMGKEAVPMGNAAGRGPGMNMGSSSNMHLGQHGGEGKNLTTKTDIKFAKVDCGPGRYL